MSFALPRGLIVSCQALPDEPLFGAQHMAVMALAAQQGGAVGIRANTPADVAAIRQMVDLPIIGLYKENLPGCDIYITPTRRHAAELAQAGADIIAIDATQRQRPDQLTLPQLLGYIHDDLHKPVLADISTLEEGLQAAAYGADFISTTLSGYTPYSTQQDEPDFDLAARLARKLSVPLVAEGRIATPNQARRALELGAHAVIIGTAITRPQWITAQFAKALQPLVVKQSQPAGVRR